MTTFEDIGRDWPELISRKEASRLTGGIAHPRTLANLDCLGKGPSQKLRIGRQVCYTKKSFIEWLKGRASAE